MKGEEKEMTQTKELTVKEWLEKLATTNTSDEYDDKMMQILLRKCGESKAAVTCGIVYLDGHGQPMDIHAIARGIMKRQS